MVTKRASYKKYNIPDDVKNIRLTDDDTRILLEVYRHDIIDAHAVRKLLAHRSPAVIGNRLRLMYQNEYLHRLPQIEEIHVPGGGSMPATYTLGAKGATRLQDVFNLKPKLQFSRYRARAKGLSSQHILHALAQTRFIVSMRSAADQRNDVEFLYPEEIYKRFAPEILERDSLPYRVRSRVHWFEYHEEEGTDPDGFFMLYYPNAPEGKQRRAIFLEIDRGEETIDPNDRKIKTVKFWKDTSMLRKFVVYAYAHITGVHKKVFGVANFQVLTVTTTPEHRKRIQKMYRNRLAGPPHKVPNMRFLFTDWQSIRTHQGDFISMPTWNGNGEDVSLV